MCCALVGLLAALGPRASTAQVGATTDIITGTVMGPDSQPLAGAVVVATSLETRVSRQRKTDAQGRYTIVFPDGGGRYELTARFIGMAATQVTVARQVDEDRIVAMIRMGLLAVPLEPITVRARSGARAERTGPGSTGTNLNPEQLARLPIDAADLNAVATLTPGVLGIAGTDSSATAFSVAGQRPSANAVTLDGMSFGAGTVPQDAIRSVRVVTTTYDVARGQFSGGLVTATTRSGTNVPQGAFTYALRDRSVAWGDATSSPFGQGTTQNQLGGGMGGPLVADRLFFFAALQGRWRDQALPSLAVIDPGTLLRLGVSPDSAARFVTLAGATGAPLTIPGHAGDRATENALGLVRLDWQLSDAHTLTLRLDGRWDSQEPIHVGPLALPATGGTRTARAGGVMASFTSYFGEHWINELRGYVARQRQDWTPFVTLPAAHVAVASALTDGSGGVAWLNFGGNGAFPQLADDRSVELADEFSWLPGRAAHRFKLGAYLNGTRAEENVTFNQFGTFTFPSLAALAADSPATFARTLTPLARAGTAWNSALYAGDAWRVGSGLYLTYGLRLEATRFSGAPPNNPGVDSLFGVRTDRIPSEVHVSPRVGFTWEAAGGPDVPHTTYLRGGVGDFRSPTPPSLYSSALAAPGLSDAERDLVCIGAAVPTPAWSRYDQDPSTIPSQCTDSATGTTVIARPDVTAFARDFTAPRARRASLGLVQRFHGTYWVTLEGSYARGVSQYGFRDLNLNATPRFTLADEAGRPIYVAADSIFPATGAVALTGSRIHPEFGKVLLIRSDLQSDTKQLTVSFAGATARGGAIRLAYTLTRARDQSSFSCCSALHGFEAPTTGGNPNTAEWATSDLERRHVFFAAVTHPINAALELGAIGRLISGVPFTPLVGSDINGDGARNDRAFIFDPARTGDTAVANGMRALLVGAPLGVRRCLLSQLGRIAGRNSCTGPWQPAFDVQLNWRPGWFGLERRLTLSLFSVNLMGGLDAWLHGAGNRHGWGYTTAPDPVLLFVRSFDPTTAQFHYLVNGRFGSTASAGGGVIVPFQLAFQAHLTLGPGPLRRSLRGGRPAAPGLPTLAPAANPISAILEWRDSLGCTPEQTARLQAIADSLEARNRSVPESLDPAVKLVAVRENAGWALERARAVLSHDQWHKLPHALRAPAAAFND
ncbi:MAG TPA: TonB-dependent receptor [Gemmatimonadales bacterium]|nr:TonB-dependent receptor [Gemmatimonadales bacterium]